jgi:hypothetical protein
MEVSGHFHTPAALSPEEELQYPLDMSLGGASQISDRHAVTYYVYRLSYSGSNSSLTKYKILN